MYYRLYLSYEREIQLQIHFDICRFNTKDNNNDATLLKLVTYWHAWIRGKHKHVIYLAVIFDFIFNKIIVDNFSNF